MELKELHPESLTDLFVKHIEGLIISGKFKIGERLPPERELSVNMKISRTIVHSGLIELNTKGLITVIPRKGTFVNDFRVNGTLAILDSLVNYKGELDERLLDSMLETRFLIEVENAGLAAANRDNYDLIKLNEIIKCEDAADYKNIEEIVNVDFTFHHQVAMATKNIIYPLIIKSFEGTYKNLTTKFFKKDNVIPAVFDFHKRLYNSINDKSIEKSKEIMKEILNHGKLYLKS
jgi:GntR family transcriptional repressor for pyruvate dehydrogenase complex